MGRTRQGLGLTLRPRLGSRPSGVSFFPHGSCSATVYIGLTLPKLKSLSSVKLAHRITAFVKERAAPVLLLWLAVGLGCLLVPAALTKLSDSNVTLPSLPMASIVDPRILGFFLVGFVTLLALFAMLEKAKKFSDGEQKNMQELFERIWDEISSASTHIAFGTVAVWILTPRGATGFPWTTIAYLTIGVFCFRHRAASQPATVSSEIS